MKQLPTRQNFSKGVLGRPHMVLYVTPRDVPYRCAKDVLYRRP